MKERGLVAWALLGAIGLALSGCATYVYDKTVEDRTISDRREFRPTTAEPSIKVVAGQPSVISVAYWQRFNEVQVTKSGRYEKPYRFKYSYFWSYMGPREPLEEKLLEEWAREKEIRWDASEKRQEVQVKAGQPVTLEFNGYPVVLTLQQDGKLVLDSATVKAILGSLRDIDHLKNGVVSFRQGTEVSAKVDLSGVPEFKPHTSANEPVLVFANTKTVPATATLADYQKAQDALVARASSVEFPYQKKLLQDQFLRNTATVGDALQAKLDDLGSKVPTFIIQGQIVTTDTLQLVIFGEAVPQPLNTATFAHPGYVRAKGNIVIMAPYKLSNPSTFFGSGLYYVNSTTGQNSFGQDVAVKVFATQPPARDREIAQQKDAVAADLQALKKDSAEADARFGLKW